MGYDGLFFARNDYDDKNQRLKDNTMEMVWRPSRSLGNASDLFTGLFLFHYGPPPGMCFDIKCTDPPIQVPVICIIVYDISMNCIGLCYNVIIIIILLYTIWYHKSLPSPAI